MFKVPANVVQAPHLFEIGKCIYHNLKVDYPRVASSNPVSVVTDYCEFLSCALCNTIHSGLHS